MVLYSMCGIVQTGILARDREAYRSVIHVWVELWLDHLLLNHRLSVLIDVLAVVQELLNASKSLLLHLVSSVHYFNLYRILLYYHIDGP